MTDLKTAMEIRDKILKSAPSVYTSENEIEKWANAMLLAEAYFKVSAPDGGNLQEECLNLYLGSYCVQYIARALSLSEGEVVEYLNASRVPVVKTAMPLDLLIVNEMAVDEFVALAQKYPGVEKAVQGLVESYNYVPLMRVERQALDTSAVQKMLQDGFSYGDIARYCNITVAELFTSVDLKCSGREAKENDAIVEDWMCGKSVIFIAMKYSTSVDEIREILEDCHYTLLAGECNIHDVNKTVGSSRRYLTIDPKLDTADLQIVKRMKTSGYPDDRLATAIGVALENLQGFLSLESFMK